jgi:hypothetical protein
MPSITYWNRLEPRPRSKSVGHSLSAKIRDPLWFMARQLQFCEYKGEDKASPAYIQFSASFSRIEQWHPQNGEPLTVDATAPLEAQIQAEAFTADYSTAVELGQQFEVFLKEAIADNADRANVLTETLNNFALTKPEDIVSASRDTALINFLRVFAGKAIDGTELVRMYVAEADIPSSLNIPSHLQELYRAALRKLKSWMEATYGVLGNQDSTAWLPDRLEYGLDVTAVSPSGEHVRLNAYPGQNGEFDWYDFDQAAVVPSSEEGQDTDTVIHSVLPANVRFTGMSNARWWQFERGDFNLSDIKIDPADTAKMALLDFVLIHSNDWFYIPIAQPVGTLGRLNALLVHDVFGDVTFISPAVTESSDPTNRWSMFTTSVAGGTATTDYYVLPPGPGTLDMQSEAIEEVRFLRDEMFNSAFAVEHLTENGLGDRWLGNERVQPKPLDYETNNTNSPLKYLIQSWLPENWIPFIPVCQDVNTGEVNYERAPVIRPDPQGNLRPVMPHGRILNPTRLADSNVYSIYEEEIPRIGMKVTRYIRRTRWLNGETCIWVARTVKPGTGEGSSGLRYDLAIPAEKKSSE